MSGTKKDFSIGDEESLKQKYPHYEKYWNEKQELKKQYPSDLFVTTLGSGNHKLLYPQEERDLHKEYLSKLVDILVQPNGNYQKFVWESMSDIDKLQQERTASGRVRKLNY